MEKRQRGAKNAFYEPPACVTKTSSEIISEARAAIMNTGLSSTSSVSTTVIQPVNTKRPYTPRDSQRTLFGRSRGLGQRPPSSFSLRYLQHQDSGDSTDLNFSSSQNSKRTAYLQPMPELNRSFMSGDSGSISDLANASANTSTHLPSISKIVESQDVRRKRRHQFRAATSLDNLPEELEGTDNTSKAQTPDIPSRNAYSSPKEHIERLVESFDGEKSPWEESQMSLTKTTKTPRKMMKHDIHPMSQSCSTVEAVSSNQEFEKNIFQSKNKTSILSLDVGKLPKETHGNTMTLTAAIEHEPSNANSSSHIDLEKNLFGPAVSEAEARGTHHSAAEAEVDGGVFGEKLHDNNGIPNKLGFESIKESAIYDNCINEAKLARVHRGKFLDENPSATSVIHQILNKLTELAINGGADAAVMHNLDKLYDALLASGFQRKGDINTKLKSQILKCVYRFVERSEDHLLLKLARIIFCLPVSGSTLAGVCKLVFKVARSDKNDELFLEGNILDMFIDALGTASPLEDAEACVYGYGALKFLTMNNEVLGHVLDLGTLDLMVLHLKIVNSVRAEGGRLPEQTSHAIFQLTGALRNIAGEEDTFPMLVANGAVLQLCHSMELFSTDLDLVTNIARTFSIISTNDDCCDAIARYKNCTKLFSKLFSKYPGRQDIVVRLGYALGNLLAKSDGIRSQLLETEGAMDTLFDVLELYLQKDLDLASQDSKQMPLRELSSSLESGSDGSVEDVIVKIIRIVANMSMNLEVGERLTCLSNHVLANPKSNDKEDSWNVHHHREDCAIGHRAVCLLLTVLRRKSVAESAELVLSTLSTLNNLTFYPSRAENSIFEAHLMDLSQALYTLLMSNLDECLVETTKVLGNLTRSKPARDFLLETGGLNQLLKFLQTDNHELLRSTVGVLVNLMADPDKRDALQHSEGVTRLIALLRYHGETDWQLASLICQVLWNFCIDMTNLTWLGTDHTTQLVEILVDFLDDEHLFGGKDSGVGELKIMNGNTNDIIGAYQQWEDFAVIATNLLEKIETFMDSSQQGALPTAFSLTQLKISAGGAQDQVNQWEEIRSSS